jgi:hypothetical protein
MPLETGAFFISLSVINYMKLYLSMFLYYPYNKAILEQIKFSGI